MRFSSYFPMHYVLHIKIFMCFHSGLSKKKPPSEALVNGHKEQLRIQEDLEPDHSFLTGIIRDLEKAYSHAKGDFMLGRYEELKNMIKQANQEFKQRSEHKKERQLARYQSKQDGGKKVSASGLRATAAVFAGQQTKLQEQEKHYAGMDCRLNTRYKKF